MISISSAGVALAACAASTCSAAAIAVSTRLAVSPTSAPCSVTATSAPLSRSTACSALCARCVRPSFILVIFASGSNGFFQSLFDVRFFRRRSRRAKAHEAAHRERIGRTPGEAALRVEPFEVPEQQQPEVPPWRQAGPPHHWRVERPTLLLREPVEAGLVENGVQPRIERMARRDRQIGGRHPHRSLLALAFAHRHASYFTQSP